MLRHVLIGHIAAATKTIRVASDGVMLPNHAPLVVVEQFDTLDALYPGRIVGRAPGGDLQTMRALRRDLGQNGDDFPALLEELQTYLGPEKPGQLVRASPGQGSNVQLRYWVEVVQRTTGRGLGIAFRFRRPLRPRLFARSGTRVSRESGRGWRM